MNRQQVLVPEEIQIYQNTFYPQNAPYISKHKREQQYRLSRQSINSVNSNNSNGNAIQNNSTGSQTQLNSNKDRALQTSQAKSQKYLQLEQQIIKLNKDIEQLLQKIDGNYEADQQNKDKIKQLQDQNYYLKQEIQKINNLSMENQLKLRLQKEQLEKLYKKQIASRSSKTKSEQQANQSQNHDKQIRKERQYEDQINDQQNEQSKQGASNKHTINYDIATRYIRPSRQIIIEQSKQSAGSNFRQIQLQKIHLQQVNKKMQEQIQYLSLQLQQKRREVSSLRHSLSNHGYSKSQLEQDTEERIQQIQKQLVSKYENKIISLENTVQQYRCLFQKKSQELSNNQYELYKYSSQIQRLNSELNQQKRYSQITKDQKQKEIIALKEKLNKQIQSYRQRIHTQQNLTQKQDQDQENLKHYRYSQQIYREKQANSSNFNNGQNSNRLDEQHLSLNQKDDINKLLQKRLKNIDSQRQRISQLSSINAGNNVNSAKRHSPYKSQIESKVTKQNQAQHSSIKSPTSSSKMNKIPKSNRSELANNRQDLNKTMKLTEDQKELLERRLQKVNKDIARLKNCIDQAYLNLQITPNQSVSAVQRAIDLVQLLSQEFLRQTQSQQSIKHEKKSLRLQLDRANLRIKSLTHQNRILIANLNQITFGQQKLAESIQNTARQVPKALKNRNQATFKEQSQKGSRIGNQLKIQKYDQEKRILAKLKQNITKMINDSKL